MISVVFALAGIASALLLIAHRIGKLTAELHKLRTDDSERHRAF